MKSLLKIFLLFSLSLQLTGAQEGDFPAPADWRKEVIALPPDFAPDMSWKGTEVLRFSPGMFNPESEEFFTYVFSLKLENDDPDWQEQLLVYYEGLAKAVLEDKNLDTSDFRLELEGDNQVSYGKLHWIEPFATKKAQTLYLELHKISEDTWFVCASPQIPRSPVWTEMRLIRQEAAGS